MAMVAFQMVDPVGARLYSGLLGETNTATELRKLRRHGWRSIPNLQFREGEVDVVAVGPGGVLVIEVKLSNADWGFLVREGVATRWATQASRGAFRVRWLIRQQSGHVIEPVPLVVGWIPGQPEQPTIIDNGVTGVHGSALRRCLTSLPYTLAPADVEAIATGLTKAARQFDQAAFRYPGRLRRLLGDETRRSD